MKGEDMGVRNRCLRLMELVREFRIYVFIKTVVKSDTVFHGIWEGIACVHEIGRK